MVLIIRGHITIADLVHKSSPTPTSPEKQQLRGSCGWCQWAALDVSDAYDTWHLWGRQLPSFGPGREEYAVQGSQSVQVGGWVAGALRVHVLGYGSVLLDEAFYAALVRTAKVVTCCY